MEPKYPKVSVRLSGEDGNAYAVMAAARRAMMRAGVENAIIDQYASEATSGDYDHLIQTTMKWVQVN